MQAANAPSKIELPWADSGTKNTIPVASQIGVTPGAASFTTGFPPLNFMPIAAGGVPPFGADFNGIFYAITAILRWQSAGGSFTYDATYADAIGGYPKGAWLERADGGGFWLNTVDGNSTDPDAGGAGWVPGFNFGVAAVSGLSNANVTLNAPQAAKPIIALSGALTANIQVIFPAWAAQWLVINNTTGAYTVTCKTASGTGVAVQQGSATQLYGDGTNLAQPAISGGIQVLGAAPASNIGATIYVPPYGIMNWDSAAGIYIAERAGDMYHTGAIRAYELELNGQTVSKTTYAGLWARVQQMGITASSSGYQDGVLTFWDVNGTSFRLPKLSGRFMRNVNTTGSGVDAGRGARTAQDDAIQNITGQIYLDNEMASGASGAFEDTADVGTGGATNDPVGRRVTFDASRVVRTASETRASNTAAYYVVHI